MNNFNHLIQQLVLFGLPQAIAQEFCAFLQKCGLTDEDIEKLNKYSLKWAWLLTLEIFFKGFIIPDYVYNVLRASTIEVKEPDLFLSMQGFLNNPTYNKAIELQNKINDGIPKDILKDLYDIIHKFSK